MMHFFQMSHNCGFVNYSTVKCISPTSFVPAHNQKPIPNLEFLERNLRYFTLLYWPFRDWFKVNKVVLIYMVCCIGTNSVTFRNPLTDCYGKG